MTIIPKYGRDIMWNPDKCDPKTTATGCLCRLSFGFHFLCFIFFKRLERYTVRQLQRVSKKTVRRWSTPASITIRFSQNCAVDNSHFSVHIMQIQSNKSHNNTFKCLEPHLNYIYIQKAPKSRRKNNLHYCCSVISFALTGEVTLIRIDFFLMLFYSTWVFVFVVVCWFCFYANEVPHFPVRFPPT